MAMFPTAKETARADTGAGVPAEVPGADVYADWIAIEPPQLIGATLGALLGAAAAPNKVAGAAIGGVLGWMLGGVWGLASRVE